jgi:hypothetical protein
VRRARGTGSIVALGVALALALTATASPARAATDAAEAERLMAEGIALRQASKDTEALADFARAFELSHDPKARAQMALAEQALGQWDLAEAHLEEALAVDTPWIAKHRTDLSGALVDIRSHLGTLEVLGGATGAEVRVNGQVVGRMPLAKPLRVPAGTFALEVRAPGFVPVARNVTVAPGGLARETIALARDEAWRAPAAATPEPVAAAPAVVVATPAPEPAGAPSWRRPAAWASAGGAAVALAVSIVFTTRVYSYADKFNASCGLDDPNLGGGSCRSWHDTSTGAEAPAIIGYSLAAVLAGTSAYLFVTSRGHKQEGGVAWSCAPGGGAPGVACAARF